MLAASKFTTEEAQALRAAFDHFDDDGSGKIDLHELRRALWSCGIECSEEDTVQMMSTVDNSGDLEIDFDEFLLLVANFRAGQDYASSTESCSDDGDHQRALDLGEDDDLRGQWGLPSEASSPMAGSRRRTSMHRDSLGAGVFDQSAEDSGALYQKRVAVVSQWPANDLQGLLDRLRTIREAIVDRTSASTGEEDDRKTVSRAVAALASAGCTYVPSGSHARLIRQQREQHLNELMQSGGKAGNKAQQGGPVFTPAQPTASQILHFISELMDAVAERLAEMVDLITCFNSDDLYGRNDDDEATHKRQQAMLMLVEAAQGKSKSLAQGSSSEEDDMLSDGGDHSVSRPDSPLSADATLNSNTAKSLQPQKGGGADGSTSSTPSTANKDAKKSERGGKKKGSAGATDKDSLRKKKLEAALDDLSTFTFAVERDADQVVGSDAFRAKAKEFPYFMFPIGTVCQRIDALEKLHDTYEKALEGKEFMLRPRCKDGSGCKAIGILEHQLAFSHPCYADTIPCPHRHRPMHMLCYHHDEDENPTVEAELREMQRRLYDLDLGNMEMGDTGARCVAHVLDRDIALRGKDGFRVRHLKMGGNQVSPAGASALFDAARHLLSLDMSNNGLGYKGGAMLVGSAVGPSLQRLLSQSECLLSLNLSRNRLSDRDARYITEAMKTNTTLTTLDLRKNELGPLFGADMASALQENRDLRRIYVGWNRLEGSGTCALLNEMRTMSTLEELDLSWTGVNNDGAKMLAEMVAGSQLLKALHLGHNSITGEGLGPLSKAVQGSRCLQHLDLSFNGLGTKATREFLRDLRDNFIIEYVDIRCVKANDDIGEDVKGYIKLRGDPSKGGKPPTIMFGASVTGGVGAPMDPIKTAKHQH